ncbi:hypothetical protein ACEQ8H_007682 [Pleosporales sp. CAS-2024a]
MRALALVVGAAAVTGEVMQYGAPIDQALASAVAARDECSALPAMCTGPAMISGMDVTLTYICLQTSSMERMTTVHVTVTATKTITEGAEGSTTPVLDPILSPAPPADTPHGPDAPRTSSAGDVTTTTTIHSTTKLTKTLTVTNKTAPASLPPAPSTTLADSPMSIEPPMFATTTGMVITVPAPDPSFHSKPHGTGPSASWRLPVPVFSKHVPHPIPSEMPAISLVTLSSNMTLIGAPSGSVMVNSHGFTSHNSTSMRGYQFPTLQDRGPATTTTTTNSGAKASPTGGTGKEGVFVAGMVFGLAAALCLA